MHDHGITHSRGSQPRGRQQEEEIVRDEEGIERMDENERQKQILVGRFWLVEAKVRGFLI